MGRDVALEEYVNKKTKCCVTGFRNIQTFFCVQKRLCLR